MPKEADENGKQPRVAANPLKAFAQWLARVLQVAVLVLENFIEYLGQEPERNWEIALYMRGFSVRVPSTDAMVKSAKKYAEKGEAESALRLFIKVLETDPDRTDVLDASAELLAELGDVDGAKDLLLKSVELSPNKGHAKYVLLGHMEHGKRAVEAFERGYDLLKVEESTLENALDDSRAEEKREVKKQLSSVLTAIAKVFLTDCFMEDGSLDHCDRLLDQALQYDPDNPEACQALADLRLTQNRRGESLMLVRRTVEVTHHLDDGLAPSYDFRTVTARLLVELSQYETAVAILKELSEEDNEDTEVLYLMGICYILLGKVELCGKVLKRAKDLLERGQGGNDSQSLLEQIDALLSRRSVSEDEKKAFWNPRWWVREESGKAGAFGPEGNGSGKPPEADAGLDAFQMALPAIPGKPTAAPDTPKGIDLPV